MQKSTSSLKPGIDYIGVGVGAIMVDKDGRLFLARRGQNTNNEHGLWEFPGGTVEFGDTLADTLRREMHEEFGIEIEVGELLDVVDHLLPEEAQHWVSPAFLCQITRGEPVIQEPDKCSEIGWYDPSEMPPDSELTKVTRANWEHYRTHCLSQT